MANGIIYLNDKSKNKILNCVTTTELLNALKLDFIEQKDITSDLLKQWFEKDTKRNIAISFNDSSGNLKFFEKELPARISKREIIRLWKDYIAANNRVEKIYKKGALDVIEDFKRSFLQEEWYLILSPNEKRQAMEFIYNTIINDFHNFFSQKSK